MYFLFKVRCIECNCFDFRKRKKKSSYVHSKLFIMEVLEVHTRTPLGVNTYDTYNPCLLLPAAVCLSRSRSRPSACLFIFFPLRSGVCWREQVLPKGFSSIYYTSKDGAGACVHWGFWLCSILAIRGE